MIKKNTLSKALMSPTIGRAVCKKSREKFDDTLSASNLLAFMTASKLCQFMTILYAFKECNFTPNIFKLVCLAISFFSFDQ